MDSNLVALVYGTSNRPDIEFFTKLFFPEGRNRTQSRSHKMSDIFDSAASNQAGQIGSLGVFAGKTGGAASSYGWPTPEFQVQTAGQDYKLNRDEAATVVALFQRLRDGFNDNSLKALDVAIRRFNLSYSRTLPEGKIIDLTVALESTLLHGIEAELQYRLSIIGAALPES